MRKQLDKRFWAALLIFGLMGQIAWVVENMYFNVFIYKMFHASAADISAMVMASAVTAAVTTIIMGAVSDRVGRRKAFMSVGYLIWGHYDGATQTAELSVTPEQNEVTGAWYIMAVSVSNATGAVAWMPHRSPLRQLAWDAGSIFRVLKGLTTPKEAKATSQALGGPVMIAEGLYRQVRRNPWDGIGFLRFLNVNLAILNLLPIPVLDGGLILFSLFALVFRRRVPDVVVKYLSLTFMVLLIGLMGLLILRDSWRSYKIHTYDPAATNATSSAARP